MTDAKHPRAVAPATTRSPEAPASSDDSEEAGDVTAMMDVDSATMLAARTRGGSDPPSSFDAVTQMVEVNEHGEVVQDSSAPRARALPTPDDVETRPPPPPDEENAPTTMFEGAKPPIEAPLQRRDRPTWLKGTPTLPSVRDYRNAPWRDRWLLYVGLGVFAVGAGAYGAAHRVAQRDPAVAAEPTEVVIDVRAEPSGARVLLDGKNVGAVPFTTSLPRDGARRTLSLEAPNHKPWQVELRMDTSVVVDAALEPTSVSGGAPQRK